MRDEIGLGVGMGPLVVGDQPARAGIRPVVQSNSPSTSSSPASSSPAMSSGRSSSASNAVSGSSSASS